MKHTYLSLAIVAGLMLSCGSGEQQTESEESSMEESTEAMEEEEEMELIGSAAELTADQTAFFVRPKDSAELSSPVIVEFGVEGMDVEPAGELAKNKGHHHIVIDGSFIKKGTVVPANETHIHYGDGSTTDTLDLEPGVHTLTMQFADGLHNSYGEQMSETITVTVK